MLKENLKKPLLIVSAIAFMGSTAFGTAAMFQEGLNPPKEDAKTATAPSQDSQIQAQVSGYEQVLKREPDNQVALQGLVQGKLALNDFKGAIAPMEKLVKLNPDRPDYKGLLAALKQKDAPSKSKVNK
jgi:cytochrome c-type biogenesis protein CcmH/NrfG